MADRHGEPSNAPSPINGIAARVFDGESFSVAALLLAFLAIALGLAVWVFIAGNDEAAGTLMAAEREVLAISRAAMLVVVAILTGLVLMAWRWPTPLLRRRIPAGIAYGLSLVLAILVMLIASGQARDWAVALHVRESPVLAGEQGLKTTRAYLEGIFTSYEGAAQPAAYFEGAWRRQGQVFRNDLRRLEIHRRGEQLLVRIWYECVPGGVPCDAGEVVAEIVRSKDGLIASLSAEVDFPEGHLWMRMAKGQVGSAEGVIATQGYLRKTPEWQISSSPKALWREKPGVPVTEFLGDWSRSFPGEIDDLTRLSVRESSPGTHVMRVWTRCEEVRECDLGEMPMVIEAEAGRVRAAWSRFTSTGRELLVSLEPPDAGRSIAFSEISRISYETVTTPGGRSPGRSVVREKGRRISTGRIALHRGHPVEPLAALVAAGPLGLAPVTEGARAEQGCSALDDLHLAVMRGCSDRLSALKDRLELRNRLGQTPLALAVLQNKPEMVKALLELGADINAPIRFGEGEWPVSSGLQRAQRPELAAGSTPLILASNAPMASLLLRAGAEKDIKNSYGWSAVFYYTHHGSTEMLDALLAAGADINATADVDPSHRGTTALMWAAYMNRTAHLQTLLKYQPRLDIRDAAGKTALDYAKGFGHAEAVRLLSSPGS